MTQNRDASDPDHLGDQAAEQAPTADADARDLGAADVGRGLSARWRLFWRLVQLGLLAAVLYFVGRALVQSIRGISWGELHVQPAYLAAAVAALLVNGLLGLFPYRRLLSCVSRAPGWVEMMPIVWIPPLGKYVPGKLVSVAGRCGFCGATV